jgi:hypothetical protein
VSVFYPAADNVKAIGHNQLCDAGCCLTAYASNSLLCNATRFVVPDPLDNTKTLGFFSRRADTLLAMERGAMTLAGARTKLLAASSSHRLQPCMAFRLMPLPPPLALTAAIPALLLLPGPVRLVQGNVGFIARYPVFLPFTNVPSGSVVPTTKNDASMYDAGGFYDTSGLGSARIADGLGEWSPYKCGSACYNATHYLWGITSSALDFVELLKVSGLQNLDRRGYDYRLVKLANATTGNTTWVTGASHHRSCPPRPCAPVRVTVRTSDQTSNRCQALPNPADPATAGVNITFDVSTTREVAGLTFILELSPRSGVYPIWRVAFCPALASITPACCDTGDAAAAFSERAT